MMVRSGFMLGFRYADAPGNSKVHPKWNVKMNIGANPIGDAVNVAEEIADPLEGLRGKCVADAGAEFATE
jgi:hypothetical protein